MTESMFLALLDLTPQRWLVEDNGAIRLDERCPLEVVAGCVGIPGASKRLFGRRDDTLAWRIVKAADHRSGSRLRQRLLTACGLAKGG